MNWASRYALATVAATTLVLSALHAGLHSPGGGRGTATLSAEAADARLQPPAPAASSLGGGVASEQASLEQMRQQVAAAADAAGAQQLTQLAQASAWLKAADARPAPPAPTVLPPPADAGPGQRALAAAEAEEGKPYRYAGAGPDSFDCSGLTMFAWKAAGVSLPHSATDQYQSTPHVPLSDLQPGDLLYFGSSVNDIGHVTMYVSPGRMIEAEDTGTVVSINPIRSDLVGASRP